MGCVVTFAILAARALSIAAQTTITTADGPVTVTSTVTQYLTVAPTEALMAMSCCAYPVTCKDLGFRAGNIKCKADCTSDVSGCVKGPPKCSSGSNPQFVPNSDTLVWDFGPQGKKGKNCTTDFGPSDIAYHERLDKLVVASDKRQYALVDPEGQSADCFVVPGDNEALAIPDPNTESVFLSSETEGTEGMAFLREWNIATVTEVRTWAVNFSMPDVPKEPGNDGVEASAFVPVEGHPEGGTFYFGGQADALVRGNCTVPFKTDPQADPSKVYQCGLSIKPDPLREVSGLCYDPDSTIGGARNGVLFISSDKDELVVAYSLEGQSLGWQAPFPAAAAPGEEGFIVRGCQAYVTSDDNELNQKVWRFGFQTLGNCTDGVQNQDELCVDVGGVCGGYDSAKEVDCADGVDNDCDGFADLDDDDCKNTTTPTPTPQR